MKSYLITDPKYYSNDIQIFENTLTRILKNKTPDIVCFRDKESKNIEALIKTFVHVCYEEKIKIFLSTAILNLLSSIK
jgi:thiamine-phosphate pyrophosphorylase